jgi:hypothetical protein
VVREEINAIFLFYLFSLGKDSQQQKVFYIISYANVRKWTILQFPAPS